MSQTRNPFLITVAALALNVVPLAHAQEGTQERTQESAAAPVVAGAAQENQEKAAQTYRSAAEAAEAAQRLSNQARAQYPAGSASIDQTLWKQAAAAAEQAAALEPGNASYQALRAQMYTETGFWSRARDAWQAYFALAGGVPSAEARQGAAQTYYNLAYAAYTRRDLGGAAALLDECLNLAPDAAPCLLWAGRVALEQGRYPAAQDLYSRAAQADPQNRTAAY